MAGKGCLKGDIRGFPVSYFSDHNNVGILAKNRTQGFGKSHLHCLVNLNLGNSVNFIFYGIFHCCNIYGFGFEKLQSGIKGS